MLTGPCSSISAAVVHAGVFMVVQRFRSDLGLFVHLHALITDGAFEECGGEVRFMPAATPTPERLTAVLAQVHKTVAAEDDDLDLDPALAACVQLGLAGPHLAPPQEPATRPPLAASPALRGLTGSLRLVYEGATLTHGPERVLLLLDASGSSRRAPRPAARG